MSGKFLVFLGLVAFAGYSLTRKTPPVPPGSSAADSAALASAGYGARLHYGIGELGSKMMGRSVRGMVASTEQSLKEMRSEIKSPKGSLTHAPQFAKKIEKMDKEALSELELGHPINAFRTAMEAKSLIAAVRDQLGPKS